MFTDDQFQIICEVLLKQAHAYDRLAAAVERLAPATQQTPPNYKRSLSDFHNFDWSTIGAEIERKDKDGVATVLWGGQRFVRRAISNKFGDIIMFSRGDGKNEDGTPRYVYLVRFENTDKIQVQPMSDRLIKATTIESWQLWTNADDGIAWAMKQLPNYKEETLREIMGKMQPDTSGKRRIPFFNYVLMLKSREYGTQQPAAPAIQ